METETETEQKGKEWKWRWRQRCGDMGDRRRVIEPWGSGGHLDPAAEGLCQAWHCIMQAHLTKLELVILDSFSVHPACIVHC